MPAPPTRSQQDSMKSARAGTATAGSNKTTKTGAGYNSPAATKTQSKDGGNFSAHAAERERDVAVKGGIQQGTERNNFSVPTPRPSPFKIETPRGWQDLWQPSELFDENLVDHDLLNSLKYGAFNSNKIVSPFSGQRPFGKRSSNHWGNLDNLGDAIDVSVLNPDTGEAYPNYQSPENFRTYEDYAQAVKRASQKVNPELGDRIRWGGYFGGELGKDKYGRDKHYGAQDLMHFDTDKLDLGMAGGSWEGGLTPVQLHLSDNFRPGAKSVGMGEIGDVDVARRPNVYDALKPIAVDTVAGAKDIASNLAKRVSGLFGQNGEPVSPPIPQRKPAPPTGEPEQRAWMNPGNAPDPYGEYEQRAWMNPGNAPDPYAGRTMPPVTRSIAQQPSTNTFGGDREYETERQLSGLERQRNMQAENDARSKLKQSAERELVERGHVNPKLAQKPFVAGSDPYAGRTAAPSFSPARQAAGTDLSGYDGDYFNEKPLPSLGPNSSLFEKTDLPKPNVSVVPQGPITPWEGVPEKPRPPTFSAGPDPYIYAPPPVTAPIKAGPAFNAGPDPYAGRTAPPSLAFNTRPRALGADKYGDPDGIRNIVENEPQPTDGVVDDAGDIDRVPTAKEVLATRKLNQAVINGDPTTLDKIKKAGSYAKDALTIIQNPYIGIPTVAGRRVYQAIKGDMEKLKYLKENYPTTYTAEIARRQAWQAEHEKLTTRSGTSNGNGPPVPSDAPSTDQPVIDDNDEEEDSPNYTPPSFMGLPSDFEHYGERPQHRYFARGGIVRLNRPPI